MHVILALLVLSQIPTLPALNGTITGVVRVAAFVPPGVDELKPSALASLGETDSEGRYRLEGVRPGRYYISAGRVDLPTYYPGSTVLSEGTIVTVTSGATLSGMDFVLRNESSGRGSSATVIYGAMAAGFSIPVNIQVEGGGKVPVFQNGNYPVITATKVSSNAPFEILFSEAFLRLPIPPGTTSDEYRISNVRRTFAIVGAEFKIPDLLPGAYSLTINVSDYVTATQPVIVGTEDLKLDLIAQKEP